MPYNTTTLPSDIETPFSDIEDIVADISAGKMVIMVDDENRENEGDLLMAASLVRPQDINFMATHGRGLICVTLMPEDADRLDLRPMTAANTDPKGTAFTISVDASTKFGVTTGISALRRACFITTRNSTWPLARARVTYSDHPMFSENTPKSFFVLRLQISASSGTAP